MKNNNTTISNRGHLPRPVLAILVVLCFLPLFVKDQFFIHLAVSFAIYCALATSLNLVVGYAGQVSFAHAAFFGIGAYTSALLALKWGWNFWFGMLSSFFLVTILAFLVGIPTLRLRGSYLTICTMGLQLIVDTLILKWVKLTNGPMGLTGIPSPKFFGISLADPANYYYLAYLWLFLNILLLWRVEASRIGFEMLAIREDEDAARATGVNSGALKLWAFSVSAGLAGATGAVYAHYIGSIDPSPFKLSFSSIILVMVIMGGRGTILGGAVGALALSLIPEWLRFLQNYRMIMYGLAMILLIMYMPKGLLGWFSGIHDWWISSREVKNVGSSGR